MSRLQVLIILVTMIPPKLVFTQGSIGFEGSAQRGFLIAHRPVMHHLPQENLMSYEFGVTFRTTGAGQVSRMDKMWHQLYKYPKWGINFIATGTGNKAILGNGFGLYGYLEPTLHSKNKLALNLRLGAGLGYLTETFHPTENHKNVAIGSNLNILINFKLMANYSLPLTDIWAGITFTHFSNASFSSPNLGINLPALQLGVRRFVKPFDYSGGFEIDEKQKSKTDILLTAGLRETHPEDQQKYPAYTATLVHEKTIGFRSALLIGFDIMYNTAHAHILNKSEISYPSSLSLINPGISIGYAQLFDRFSIGMQMGLYVYRFHNFNGPVYHRIVAKHKIGSRLLAVCALKTHYAKADYFEVGLGYRF